MILVRPREPDMVIRDPRSRLKLPPYGGKVPNTSYWLRRLNCGDVVSTTSDAIDKGKADEAKAKAELLAKEKEDAKAKAKADNQSAAKSEKANKKTSAGKGSK